MAVRTTDGNRPHISQLCERGLQGLHLDIMIGVCMRHKKRKKERADATRASVKKEMAKPRMARSARMMELILDTTRIPGQPSTTKP